QLEDVHDTVCRAVPSAGAPATCPPAGSGRAARSVIRMSFRIRHGGSIVHRAAGWPAEPRKGTRLPDMSRCHAGFILTAAWRKNMIAVRLLEGTEVPSHDLAERGSDHVGYSRRRTSDRGGGMHSDRREAAADCT